MEPYRFTAGSAPLLVSMPHVGTHLPPELAARLTPAARGLPDTDWHVDRLYDFLGELGASVIAATHSRYVIDLNRDPEGKPLYPGASETELCPTSSFDSAPLYRDGAAPGPDEVAARREALWRPYHERLAAELAALKARHGRVLLWDAHSIRSRVPRFFEGRLPDLNLGSGGGTSADPGLIAAVAQVLGEAAASAGRYSHAVDGRFKGGHITRRYGDPAQGIHALQLELSQITYMDEAPPYAFREDLAEGIRPVLRRLLETALDWIGGQDGGIR
ncbi:MAG: N-formylglutamate deformylase [Kiloniellales bacterium]